MTAPFSKSINDLVVCQYRAKRFTPIYFTESTIHETKLHENVLLLFFTVCLPFCCSKGWNRPVTRNGMTSFLLEYSDEFRNWPCLGLLAIVPTVKQLQKNPLGPFIII